MLLLALSNCTSIRLRFQMRILSPISAITINLLSERNLFLLATFAAACAARKKLELKCIHKLTTRKQALSVPTHLLTRLLTYQKRATLDRFPFPFANGTAQRSRTAICLFNYKKFKKLICTSSLEQTMLLQCKKEVKEATRRMPVTLPFCSASLISDLTLVKSISCFMRIRRAVKRSL